MVHDRGGAQGGPRTFSCSGTAPTKDDAKGEVERSYAQLVAASPTSRAYWLKRSAELRGRMEQRPRESR
jgi:hypothetical protein